MERAGIERVTSGLQNRPPVWLSEKLWSPEASLAFAAATITALAVGADGSREVIAYPPKSLER
jgi:hypothetical protein